nr:MAG TPA: hypothetical protein [Caudoviricetes sp.]
MWYNIYRNKGKANTKILTVSTLIDNYIQRVRREPLHIH